MNLGEKYSPFHHWHAVYTVKHLCTKVDFRSLVKAIHYLFLWPLFLFKRNTFRNKNMTEFMYSHVNRLKQVNIKSFCFRILKFFILFCLFFSSKTTRSYYLLTQFWSFEKVSVFSLVLYWSQEFCWSEISQVPKIPVELIKWLVVAQIFHRIICVQRKLTNCWSMLMGVGKDLKTGSRGN